MHARRQWTADDLLDMPDDGQRYEVIEVELFVTPAPSLSRVDVHDASLDRNPDGASTPLVLDIAAYFEEVLDT